MSTTTAASASLASVVTIEKELIQWTRVHDNQPLAKLHAKFWGRPIPEEEARHVQQQSTSHPSESNDDDTDADEDEDIKTGYVLEIDNDAINIQRIWVRVSGFPRMKLELSSRTLQADYIRIYDYLVGYYNEKAKPREPAPAVVVTGQPGIGDSLNHSLMTYH
jgi:hypothetical protein